MPAVTYYPPYDNRIDLRRMGAWCLIVLLHLGLLYALTHGLARHVTTTIPNVVMAMIVPEAPKPAAPKPAAAKPQPKKILTPLEKVRATPQIDYTPAPAVLSGSTPVRETTTHPVAAPDPVIAAPAPAPAPALPKTISGLEYLQPPRPEYPPVSRRNGEQGVVQLRVLINELGRPERIEIVKSSDSARLDEAARQAVMRAVFKPYLENGRPLPVYALLPIRFHLD